jgi:hypothetical protein
MRRWWRSQKRHRGFQYWLRFRGIPFVALVAVLYVVNGFVAGWSSAYEIAAGIGSPAHSPAPLVAWPLSIAGWLLVPGIAGAIAGYIVTDFIARRRTTPVHEVFAETGDD